MPRTGRPPKPRDLRILDGTHRKDRHGAEGEVPEANGLPVKPRGLSKDESRCWDFIATELAAMKVGKRIDSPSMLHMVEAWALARRCSSLLATDPADKDARIAYVAYVRLFDSIASRFGMTPSDRGRLRIEDPKKPQGIKARTRA